MTHSKFKTRRIPNSSWCLFREPSDGSRNGKVVIVQSRDIIVTGTRNRGANPHISLAA